jgi:flavin reductase ActVB
MSPEWVKAPPLVSADDFRAAVAGFASGVTIVTTQSADGVPAGFTASAFSSLSLDPPLVLVCLADKADCRVVFEECLGMVINILASDQTELAMRFATRGIDKFENTAHEPGTISSLPVIQGALAYLECKMHARVPAGDHTILIGQVIGACRNDGEPMIHFSRAFGTFAPSEVKK